MTLKTIDSTMKQVLLSLRIELRRKPGDEIVMCCWLASEMALIEDTERCHGKSLFSIPESELAT